MILSNGAVIPNGLPRTLADETPLFHDSSYYSSAALRLSGELWAHYGAIYRAQLWVGIVVRKRALATARMPFEVLRPDGGLQRLEAGPLQDLMDAPNRRMSGFDLWEWTSATRDIYGEAFWLKLRDNNKRVRELQPLHPRNITIRRNADTGDVEYVYGHGSDTPVFPEDDVVAFTSYNPDNLLRGVSNLESLRMTLLNEDSSRRAMSSFWAKGARPSMILTHPNELSEGAQKRLKAKAEELHGGADSMGGVAVFEEGITATVTQLSNEDMQYIESRKLNREEVCAAYDVSPLVVHILDHATFSNVTEQLRSQYRDTMAPIFSGLQSVVDTQLVPDFYDRGAAKTRFNMDDVLRGDFEARAATGLGLRQAGVFTGNETRVFVGQDPVDDPRMNDIYANAALAPLQDPAGGMSADELLKRSTVAAGFIRSGFAPAAALEAAGLDPVEHMGMLPVTLQKPVEPEAPVDQDIAAALGDDGARALEANLAAIKAAAGRNFLGRKAQRAVMGKLPAAIRKANGDRLALRDTLERAHHDALLDYYDGLRDAVKDGLQAKAAEQPAFDRNIWDANLKTVLSALARKTAEAVGEAQAAALGGTFKMSAVEDWLDLNCELGAELFNDSTADTLAEMLSADFEDDAAKLAAVDETFDEGGLVHARAGEQATTRTTVVSEFSAHHAAEHAGDGIVKTWETTSKKPRASHKGMNGETAGMDEVFSNGMKYPGDWAGGFDEVANCKCTVSYSKESEQ